MSRRMWQFATAAIVVLMLLGRTPLLATVVVTRSESLVVDQPARFAPGDRLLSMRGGEAAALAPPARRSHSCGPDSRSTAIELG